MKTHTKRLLSLVLAVVMVVAMLPANILSVFATAPESISLYAPLYGIDVTTNQGGKLSVGQQMTLQVKDPDGAAIDASAITFKSSNKQVLTVDAAGVMTGVHSGTATVTASHKDDNNVAASITVEVTNVSTYLSGLKAFNIGVKTDGVVDYGQNLTAHWGKTFGAATWTDLNATDFIPWYGYTSTSGKTNFIPDGVNTTNYSIAIARLEAGWYLRPITADYTQYISDWKYANYINSAPWVWGDLSNYETAVPYNGERSSWQFNSSNFGLYVKPATVAGNAYYSYKLMVPSAGTYTVDFSATKANLVLSLYMVPVADKNIFADNNKNYYLGDIDLNQSTTVSFDNEFVADTAGEYYFVVMFKSTTATDGTLSTIVSSIELTLDEIHEPVLNGGNNISVNGAAHYSVTQDKDSFDTPQTITDVSYSIIDGKEYVELVSNSDGTASVVGVAAGTATLQASFTGIDGKSYTKTMDITVQPARSAFYRFNLKAFNVGNPQNDGSVITTQVADDKTTMSAAWTDISAEHFLEFDVTSNVKPVWVRTNHKLWYLYYMNASANGHVSDPTFKYQRTLDTTNGYGTDPWYLHNYSEISSGYMDTNYIYMSLARSAYICLVVDVPATGTYKITPDVTGSPRTFYMAPTSVDIADIETAVDAQGESLYKVGSMASGETGKSFTKELTGGLNYFFVRFTDVITNNYATSLSLEPDIVTHTVATDTTNLSVGSSATITATKNGTVSGTGNLEITAVESSNSSVVRAFLSDSGATVTAVGAGSADVTVTYLDPNGISRQKTFTYTVSKAGVLTYNFNLQSFNVGVKSQDGTVEIGQNMANYFSGCGTAGWTDITADDFVPFYYEGKATDGINKYYYPTKSLEPTTIADSEISQFLGFVMAKSWYLRLINNHSLYPNVSTYLSDTNYKYQNDSTAKWRLGDGSWVLNAFLYTGNMAMDAYTSNRFNEGGNRPFFSFKVYIPVAGTYSAEVVTGAKSTINYHFYMFNATGVTGTDYATLCAEDNEIGTLDSTLYTSGTMADTITVTEPGEYYFVMSADNDLPTSNVSASTISMHITSLTLTPVVADLDGYTVTQNAVLSDDIEMQFNVTATGSLVAGFDVFVNDTKIGNVPVETGVKKTIGVSLIASQMSQNIKLQAVDANGEAIGGPRTYSLREYLLAVMSGNFDETTKELAKNAYNYCAMAQIHANRDTDVIKDDVVEVTPAEPDEFKGTILAGSTEGIVAKTATLLIENKISIRIYFQLTAGESIKNFTFTYGDKVLEPVASGSRYYVEVDEINPQMYKENVVITVAKGGQSGLTVTYSAMAYIQRTYHNANTTDKLKNLVMAMNGYHEAAVAYVLAHPNSVN